MANYQTLRDSVKQVIKTNGKQEITGQVLQNTLLSIISSVGTYFQFVGIATKDTNPGTPDQNVFYIAGQGTYTNFSNISVGIGELAVLRWQGSWGKQTIKVGLPPNEMNISALYPTNGAGGTNKYTLETAISQVSSIYQKIGLIVTFINESNILESWVYISGNWSVKNFYKVGSNKFKEIDNIVRLLGEERSGEKKNGLLNADGTIAANGSWVYSDYVSFKKGDVLFITIQSSPGSPYVPLQIYDEGKRVTKNIELGYNGLYEADSNGFLRICGQKGEEYVLSVVGFISGDDIQNDIDVLNILTKQLSDSIYGEYSIDIDFETYQGYIGSNGGFISNPNQRTTDFLEYDSVKYSVKCNISYLGAYINFYDENKRHLPELSNDYKINGIYVDKILNKPPQAKFYRITSAANYEYKAKAGIGGLNIDVQKLKIQTLKNTEDIEQLKGGSVSDSGKVNIPFNFSGYISANNGRLIGNENIETTDFLSFDKINYTLTSKFQSAGAYINFYDKDYKWLKEKSFEYKADGTFNDKELVKPKEAEYYRLSAQKSSAHSAFFVSKNYKKRKTINKNINWVGHSIWWYDGNPLGGSGPIARGYQTLLKEQFNLIETGRYCYSGHSLGGLTANDENSILEPATISTWKPSENALWTLDTITNDFKRNIPIGEIEDYNNNTGITTYYGALRVFKDKIQELSGDSAVIICSNALRRNNAGYTSNSTNTVGAKLEDYEKALMTIAANNRWLFVDQFRMCGVTDNSIMITTIDGLHLNNFGYTLAVIPWIQAFDYVYNMDLLYDIVL